MDSKAAQLIATLSNNSSFLHDLANRIGAAKMNAQLAARHMDLPPSVKNNLERVLVNLEAVQSMVLDARVDFATESGPARSSMTNSSVVTEPHAEAGLTKLARRTLLLVDDSSDLRSLFKVIFKARGYEVFVAKSGVEALALLADMPAAPLIFLDYNLGDETAADVLDLFEKHRPVVFADSKIVLFSGAGDQVIDHRVHAVEQKALDVESMVQTVERYFRPGNGQGAGEGASVRAGDHPS